MMKAPKPPPLPKMPQSPLDQVRLAPKEDATANAFKSLISTSPMGLRKPAMGAKKTLLGGTK